MTETEFPDFASNACAGFSPEDRENLWQAAVALVQSRGIIVRITELLGGAIDRVGGDAFGLVSKALGENWRERVQDIVEHSLRRGFRLATLGLDPESERQPWIWFNKLVASTSGAVGGFFGMPGLSVDLPVTTTMILRSVAEIARAHGEDISTDETKRACLEVFAFGGPQTEDDDIESGYWTARTALSVLATGAVLRQVARYFGVVMSEKILAQAVPVAGAVAGGGLNYVFIDYYQQMARVHFTLRALERRTGDASAVRACFDSLVRQERQRRRGRVGR